MKLSILRANIFLHDTAKEGGKHSHHYSPIVVSSYLVLNSAPWRSGLSIKVNCNDLNSVCSFMPMVAREEFELSYKITDDDFERARRTVVRSFMGFGSGAASGNKTGFRSNSNRSGTTPAHDWVNYADALPALINRIRGVVIENKDAVLLMQTHDSKQTLNYVDPPYILSTRHKGEKTSVYNFFMPGSHVLIWMPTLRMMSGSRLLLILLLKK